MSNYVTHNTTRTPYTRSNIPHALLPAGLVLLFSAAGCSSPQAPQPPGGGARYTLDFAAYQMQVAPIISARGCDNLSCHGAGIRGTFELSPDNAKDSRFDFDQVSLQVDAVNPEASPILAKPLAEAAGGAAHAAPTIPYGFSSTADPDYQTILAWIQAGTYE